MTSTERTRLTEGTAVITGGGSGIGEGLVRRLAERGMHVVVADVDADRAEAVAADVRASGGDATGRVVDVTDADAVERLAADVFEAYGDVRLLVNNAGIENSGRLWELDPQQWRRLMAVNLDGVFHGVRSFVPRMLSQAPGAIVANMASIGSMTTLPFQGAYIASKHATLGLTECLHQEVAEAGADLQVSVVLPSWVRTRIFEDAASVTTATADDAAARLEAMRVSNEAVGMDPLTAADAIVAGLVRGDFWVFTDEERGQELMSRRGEHLLARTLPAAP